MKRIIIVLSEWGYWGEELMGPLDACDTVDYEITFVILAKQKQNMTAI